MKKIILTIAAVLSLTASVFAQPKNLKIATIAPARSAWDLQQKKLAADWAKATNNNVLLQFMNATAMGGESGVIQKLNSVRPGQKAPIDGAIFTSLGIALMAPETHLLTLDVPFMFNNSDEVDYVTDKLAPKVDEAMAKKGYKFLGLFNVGWCYFYTKKPVHSADDLKKQKLSVNGMDMPALTDAFKSAGYLTADVPPAKLLASMRTPGGVEGFFTLPMYAYAGQHYKSLPYILNVPLFPLLAAFIVSKSAWDSIPPDQQKVMLEAVKVTRENFTAAQKTADKEYIDRAVAEGSTLITLTPEEMKAFQEDMYKDTPVMVKSGLADTAFYDEIQAVLKKYRESH